MSRLGEKNFEKLFGTSLMDRTDRFANFISKTPTRRIFTQTMTPPLLGLAVGGAIGGLIGSFGGPKGTAVGVGSGIGVGFLSGGTYASYKIRKEYNNWIKHYRCDEVLSELADVMANHPDIEEFICPLSHSLMHYPFKDPGGFNYEKRAIEQWVKKYGTSPKMGTHIKLSDLQPNYVFMGKLAKFYKGLLEGELKNKQLTKIQREGIQAVAKDLHDQILHCFEAENKLLYEKLLKNEISMLTYSYKMLLISQMFEQDE